MTLNNVGMLLNMTFNREVINSLVKMHKMMKNDKNYSLLKYIKLMKSMVRGEKIVKHDGKYIISTFLPPFPSEAFYTNLKAVMLEDNIFTQQMHGKRCAPISMYLCVTNKCHNNCLYCSSKNRNVGKDLSTEEWKKVISDLQNMKTAVIGITGGEPMVRKDIYELVSEIDDRSSSILFTSGFNITHEVAKELKKKGLFGIGISLDSFDKEVHNKNRNSNKAFDQAIEALKNARKAGLYTMVQTVILKDEVNEEKLFDLFRVAKENGAHEVKILEPILSGNLLTEENLKGIFYDEKTRKELIRIQHKANRKYSFPKVSSFAYTESEEKYGCGAGTQHSYISSDGILYPCDFVPMNFGNVKEKSVDILWSDMNSVIGKPKIGCFAQRVNKQVFKKSNGILPLSRELSEEICNKNKSERLPKYYRDMQ